jgi:hypothetical protein
LAAKTYFYEGDYYTLSEIAKKAGVDYDKFRNRIYNGWDIEQAIAGQLEEQPQLAPEWEGLNLVVRFPNKLPVDHTKQPSPQKEYVAWLQGSTICTGHTKPFYIVQLNATTPLIVYPTEFEVIRAHQNQTYNKRNWMLPGYAG